jgi:CBS domain-containing protein
VTVTRNFTRIFVAQLAGLTVYGPGGESIGKVRDVVSTIRLDSQPPRVLGIVVELPNRRPIFVGMLRVSGIEAQAVSLATGSVSMRQFEQRPNEVLLLGQLIGTRVTVASTQTAANIVDAGIEQTRTRDWLVNRLAVRARSGFLSRRAQVQTVPWGDVRGIDMFKLTGTKPNTQQLLNSMEALRPADAANVFRDLTEDARHELADALDDEKLADVIEELSEDDQKDVLTHLDEARAADILEAMDPDDAADLLSDLPQGVSDRLLELMEPDESAPVKRLMQYSFNTAGGLMTSEPIVLPPDATVAEALARVRDHNLTPALASMVFVCRAPQSTPTGRYLGCVHTQRLLRESPFELVAGALDTDMPKLAPSAHIEDMTRYFAAYNLVCAPVVDDEHHLLGAVSIDDLLDHLLPDNWRDEEDLGPGRIVGLR